MKFRIIGSVLLILVAAATMIFTTPPGGSQLTQPVHQQVTPPKQAGHPVN